MNEKDAKRKKTTDEDFADEDSDKRVIIFVALAILVVIGIVIFLLVGCEEKKTDGDSDGKEQDIKIPIGEDVEIETPQNDEEEEEESTAKKVAVIKTSTKKEENKNTSNNSKEDKEEEDPILKNHLVVYVYEGDQVIEDYVEEGSNAYEIIPDGYNSCKYYKEPIIPGQTSQNTPLFDFNTPITEKTIIYLDCSDDIIEYSLEYFEGSDLTDTSALTNITNNVNTQFSYPITFKIGDADIYLNSYTPNQGNLIGWYIKEVNGSFVKIESVDRNIFKYADSANKITIYAKVLNSIKVTYKNHDESESDDTTVLDTLNDINSFSPNDGSGLGIRNVCDTGSLKGWSTKKGVKYIEYRLDSSYSLDSDLVLYPVCGDKLITLLSEGDLVDTMVYTDDEIQNGQAILPDGTDLKTLGVSAPTYYVKVDKNYVAKEGETKKQVVTLSQDKQFVSSDEINLEDIQYGDVNISQTQDPDDIEEGDYVVEKEYAFNGWTETPENLGDEADPTDVLEKVEPNPADDPMDDSDDYIPTSDVLHANWVEQEEEETNTINQLNLDENSPTQNNASGASGNNSPSQEIDNENTSQNTNSNDSGEQTI